MVFVFESNARSNMIGAMHYCVATVFCLPETGKKKKNVSTVFNC